MLIYIPTEARYEQMVFKGCKGMTISKYVLESNVN